MNKQDILKSLEETIKVVESMPSDEFTKKWLEVNEYYDKLNLQNDILMDFKHSEIVIDVDVTPGVYKTTDVNGAGCSVMFGEPDEIDTLNTSLAA